MMTFEEARSELKRMASGEYHTLQFVDYGEPHDIGLHDKYSVYITGPKCTHGTGESWEEAFKEFKALNSWWKEETQPTESELMGKWDEPLPLSNATIKEEEI